MEPDAIPPALARLCPDFRGRARSGARCVRESPGPRRDRRPRAGAPEGKPTGGARGKASSTPASCAQLSLIAVRTVSPCPLHHAASRGSCGLAARCRLSRPPGFPVPREALASRWAAAPRLPRLSLLDPAARRNGPRKPHPREPRIPGTTAHLRLGASLAFFRLELSGA